ncbi:MAG: hypothetical protein HWN67_22295, partial [Candidatus Helarchaeota archaeon]|nr:hypothetical protein [Candidatus Helarchaeota archaeon]
MMDKSVEPDRVLKLEVLRREKVELIPTKRTVHVELENFDNMIESQIRKYLQDSF